jgi:cell division protein FtsQ
MPKWPLGRRARLLAAAVLGIGLFLGVTDLGRDVRSAVPVSIDDVPLAGKLGLTIEKIIVAGNNLTTDDSIIAALGLARNAPMLSLDLDGATSRLEVLPLIETATLARKWPRQLHVTITERKAVAVWYDGERYHLMDKAGRGLGVVQPATRLDLPRFAGVDAPNAWPELQKVLDQYPDLRDNLRLAEHVEQTRWDLHLENGVTLQLPVGEAAAALALYKQLVAQGVDPSIVEIDLRHPSRVAVVTRPQRSAEARDLLDETAITNSPNGS